MIRLTLHYVYSTTVLFYAILKYVLGEYEYFRSPFESSVTNPGAIAIAFYQGLFAYQGW